MASSQWSHIFRYADGSPVVGKGTGYFQLKGASGATIGQTIDLIESETVKGMYDGEVTVVGLYDVYKNNVIDDELSGSGIAIFCA